MSTTDKRNHNRQDLRVLCKNMIYCSGLPSNLTKDQLTSESYFGQYGKIEKIVVNVFPNRNYCSVYLTYSHEFEAATAILACNQFSINRSTLWCLFGTMKYCKFFLKKIQCKSMSTCPYVHAFDYKNQIEIQNSPAEAYPQHERLAEQVLLKYPERIAQLRLENKSGGELPEPLYAVDLLNLEPEEEAGQAKKIENKNVSIAEGAPKQKQTNMQKQPQSQSQKSGNTVQQEQHPQQKQQQSVTIVDIENRIKKLILKQLQRTKGSRLVGDIKQQEKNVRQILVAGLLD